FAAGAFAAIIEQADNLNAGILLAPELADDMRACIAAADDDGAAGKPSFCGPFANQHEDDTARDPQRDKACDVEAAEPDAREQIAGLGEERGADNEQEDQRPR